MPSKESRQRLIAEIVENTMSRDRTREAMHHDPQYYRIRNHLIDVLVKRSRAFQDPAVLAAHDPRRPPVVRPGLVAEEAPAAPAVDDGAAADPAEAKVVYLR